METGTKNNEPVVLIAMQQARQQVTAKEMQDWESPEQFSRKVTKSTDRWNGIEIREMDPAVEGAEEKVFNHASSVRTTAQKDGEKFDQPYGS